MPIQQKINVNPNDWKDKIGELLAHNFLYECREIEKEMPLYLISEFIEHLLDCFDSIEVYLKNQSAENWRLYSDKELAFLKKHGSHLKKYRDFNMHLYYGNPEVLTEKEIYSLEVWNELSGEQQTPNQQDFLDFIYFTRKSLLYERDFWLLQQKPLSERIAITEKTNGSEGVPEKLSKIRVRRTRSDGFTSLSVEQTVLLIYYLQEKKAFLRGDHLTDVDVGYAVELLTGYSENTLRQKIGKHYVLEDANNLTALEKLLNEVQTEIQRKLKGFKPKTD